SQGREAGELRKDLLDLLDALVDRFLSLLQGAAQLGVVRVLRVDDVPDRREGEVLEEAVAVASSTGGGVHRDRTRLGALSLRTAQPVAPGLESAHGLGQDTLQVLILGRVDE